MVYLQVHEHRRYQILADNNRLQIKAIPPTRGLIYDRNGVLLAKNKPSFNLAIVRQNTPNLKKTLAKVSTLVKITDKELEQFYKQLNRVKPFDPVPLKLKLNQQQIARVAVDLHNLPGVEIQAELVRYYPYAGSFAHTLGYVGRINEKELRSLDPTNYRGTLFVGKTGIEHYYEPLLHGKVGFQQVETDARGRIVRTLQRTDPIPGKNLKLTLDARLQLAAEAAMGNWRGAIVAIQPKTGEVLAMVSTPTFDPNLFVQGIDHKTYSQLRDSIDRPLFNRTLKGQYPPASTVKPFLGLAGLYYQATDWRHKIYDPGYFQLDNSSHKYRTWKRGGHGQVDLTRAITVSSDTYFYDLANRLGIDNIHNFMAQFGYGRYTGIDLPGERKGLLPSPQWKRAYRDLPWYPGDTVNIGIGQGMMLATPLQLAVATTALANHGWLVAPHLLKQVGQQPYQVKPNQITTIKLKHPNNWQLMQAAMVDVVNGVEGTARAIGRGADYSIAGKTGTAQVRGIKQNERYNESEVAARFRDHSLFIGFAPANNPQIAVAVLVENGGTKGKAAPIARRVMDAYLLAQDKQKPQQVAKPASVPHHLKQLALAN
jgi:penicillin-binding protein 2